MICTLHDTSPLREVKVLHSAEYDLTRQPSQLPPGKRGGGGVTVGNLCRTKIGGAGGAGGDNVREFIRVARGWVGGGGMALGSL